MLNDLRNFPKQCEEARELGREIRIEGIEKVIVTGIGGSAFSGDVLKAIAGKEIEVIVNRDYNLPDADDKTLVFAVSYSGNTEETLSALNEAKEKGCKIIGISSGGKIEEECNIDVQEQPEGAGKIYHIKVPSGIQPRNALGYLSIPMIVVLQENNLINGKHLDIMVNELKESNIEERGRRIADLLINKIPLIYSSERLKCLSYGWKTRINENSKTHAFAGQIPEMNHNELVGYTRRRDNFYTIIIRDLGDSERIKKRFLITKELIEKYEGKCSIIDTQGSNGAPPLRRGGTSNGAPPLRRGRTSNGATPLRRGGTSNLASRIFCTLHLGDWVSYYLALNYNIDPEPVEIIEYLKGRLEE